MKVIKQNWQKILLVLGLAGLVGGLMLGGPQAVPEMSAGTTSTTAAATSTTSTTSTQRGSDGT